MSNNSVKPSYGPIEKGYSASDEGSICRNSVLGIPASIKTTTRLSLVVEF